MTGTAHAPLDAFIHVRLRQGALEAHGESSFFRGHTIPRGAGEKPDGVFVRWEWDGTRLTVRNDRYGMAPLFYWADVTQICVSPSLLAVLQRGAPADLDEAGFATYLRLGFFVGDDTPFAAIRTVPPGAELTWENGRLACESGRPVTPVNPATRDQAIDGFIDLCRQSIARRPPSEEGLYMPLSGGRDSRHILFEVHAAGHRPHCVTIPRYAPRPGEDERIAPIVAQALGVPHTILRQNPSRCEVEAKKNWATHLCADEHAWYMEIVAQLGTRPVTMYDGLGGALSVPNRYHSFEALDLIASGRTTDLADRLLAEFGVQTEPYLRQVLRPEAYAAVSRDKAVARFAAELATHASAPDPVKSFNFWNRIRRELALTPYGLMRHVPTVYTPYLDHDLYDFLMGLPPTVMSRNLADGKAFHTDAINRAFPQYAHLPFEDKKAKRIDARAHNARFAAEAGRYLLRRAHLPTRWLNRGYVLPRALYAAVRPSFGESRPWFASISLYLMQMEMAAAGRFPAAIGLPTAPAPLVRAA